MRTPRLLLAVLVLLLLASPVLAHVPTFPDDNTTPATAVAVPDPVKSWSFYDSLGDGHVKLLSSDATARRTTPCWDVHSASRTLHAIVRGDGSDTQWNPSCPQRVTVPDGMGAIVVSGQRPATATYEPFAPSANYHTASFGQEVDTKRTYLIAVYEPSNRTGPVGVTIGYKEAFSPTEYVTVPFDLVRTHLWRDSRHSW